MRAAKLGNLDGIIPAIVTPMKKDGSLDEKALKKYLEWLVSQGPVALAVNTDAGEGPHLLPDEKKRVLKITVGEMAGELPVICGLAGANSSAAMAFGRDAKKLGAAGWLVFPIPAFRGAKGKDPVVLQYHRKVASLGLPMVLFQLQADLGGIEYPPELIAELVKIPESAAIKEATFDAFKYQQTVTMLKGLPKRVAILTGNDNFILESFQLGGDGALIGFGAVALAEQVEMVRAFKSGNLARALSLYERINPLAQMAFAQPVRNYRARLKEILRLQGVLPNAFVREPLLPLDSTEKKRVKDVAKRHGFL
jgi:4-hydroxy-tetrahydrodipicolinate synthase